MEGTPEERWARGYIVEMSDWSGFTTRRGVEGKVKVSPTLLKLQKSVTKFMLGDLKNIPDLTPKRGIFTTTPSERHLWKKFPDYFDFICNIYADNMEKQNERIYIFLFPPLQKYKKTTKWTK